MITLKTTTQKVCEQQPEQVDSIMISHKMHISLTKVSTALQAVRRATATRVLSGYHFNLE